MIINDAADDSSPRKVEDDIEGDSPLLVANATTNDELERAYAAYQKGSYSWVFPVWLERRLKPFDDVIIAFCQRFEGRGWFWFSYLCTGLVTIEFGIAAPIAFYILGFDGLATELAYLALLLALLSQVPKRFVWRFRPYMVNRAKMVKKDMTSSFPSRAVTCATVYSFAIVWLYMHRHETADGGLPFTWWMPFLFLFAILISSFARVNLGVHYPSDCVAGLIQGVIVCIIGTSFWKADIMGCDSCHANACYAKDPSSTITLHSLNKINWITFSVVVVLSAVIPVVSVMKPIDFWHKCDRVYGMLFPGIAFQLLFLCPNSTHARISLPPPPTPQWYDWIFALSLSAIATAICAKMQLRRPMFVYVILYCSLFIALVMWRLSGRV